MPIVTTPLNFLRCCQVYNMTHPTNVHLLIEFKLDRYNKLITAFWNVGCMLYYFFLLFYLYIPLCDADITILRTHWLWLLVIRGFKHYQTAGLACWLISIGTYQFANVLELCAALTLHSTLSAITRCVCNWFLVE